MKKWFAADHLKDPLFWFIAVGSSYAIAAYVQIFPKTTVGEAFKNVVMIVGGVAAGIAYRVIRAYLEDPDR